MPTPALPTGGIDWATDTNELCIVDPAGSVVHRSNTTMDAAGIRKLVGQLERHSVARVAIERPDGPVVEAVLADTLRTDPGRLIALAPDSPQTLALRAAVRARTDLVEARVALCNQLRAHLRIVFPGAVGLFADLELADQPDVSDPVPHRRQGRLAVGQAPRRVAGRQPLQRQGQDRHADGPARLGPDRSHR